MNENKLLELSMSFAIQIVELADTVKVPKSTCLC